MTAPLRFGVIGLGVGESHARAIARDSRCELRWVCDRDTARATALREELGATHAGTSLDEVLADPLVDAVVLATFDGDHAAQVVACLGRCMHVFVEKPLCRTAAELKAIARVARGSDRQLMVNLVLRAAPAFNRVAELVRAGSFGDIYAFDGDYLYGRFSKLIEGWRGREPGYSAFAGGGVHLVDLMIGILGEAPIAVRASGNRIASRGSAFVGSDFVAAEYRFASGVIARVTANFACVHRHHHAVRLFGTKGTFLCDDLGARLAWKRDPGGPVEPIDAPLDPPSKSALLTRFIEQIVASRPAGDGLEHELAVAAATVAVDESLLSDGWIEIPSCAQSEVLR